MTTAMETAANYDVTPSALFETLLTMVEIRQPTMVWGPPGIGKSDIARLVAEEINAEYYDIRALLLDPVDLRGIPFREQTNGHKTAVTRWAPPSFLPPQEDQEGKYLINLDELPSAPPMTQNALYQLVLDRKVGEYELPPGAAIIACGNREEDRAVVSRMSTPLASRFVHFTLKPSLDDWQKWAIKHDIAAEIIFFLRFNPQLLHQFDAKQKDPAFPCPRTWSFVSRILNNERKFTPELELSVYKGTIGEGAAISFQQFMKIFRELPDPQTIIDNPEHALIPQNRDAQIALCGSLYRIANDVNFDAITTYAQRLGSQEIGQFMIDSCIRHKPNLQQTRAWIKWTTENQ